MKLSQFQEKWPTILEKSKNIKRIKLTNFRDVTNELTNNSRTDYFSATDDRFKRIQVNRSCPLIALYRSAGHNGPQSIF